MTLIKSLLLGSAAGIVAVASAQAADLPTKKAAPAEYVRICNVNGVAGFVIPGSDTCLKISGYITGQIEAGNLQTGYVWKAQGKTTATVGTNFRDSLGYTTRANLTMDTVSNTAYGPLVGHFEIQSENGSGFDNTGGASYINRAYIQWAGITAGKANSFFSFTGGGAAWANIFSPDQQGFNQPDLLAYTASFGGGFSATLSLQNPKGTPNGSGTQMGGNYVFHGLQYPDIVGQLKVEQGWGSAAVSGVAHNVNVTDGAGFSQNVWGYAFDAGVTFKLPTLGPGDDITFTGAYSKNAIWYSGIPDGMWGENGAVNGNGLAMTVADTYSLGGGKWSTPTAWSLTGIFNHHFSPMFSFSPEISYASLNWSNNTITPNATSWIAGGVFHWDPVANLDFEFELLYQDTHQQTPTAYTAAGNGGLAFPANSNGYAARFEITRAF